MIKDNAQQLLQKEMNRKDFLKHVGIAVAAVAGVSTALSALTQLQSSNSSQQSNGMGYGGSAYGR